jgi:hypothetical protein
MALRSICVSVKKLSEKPLPASAQPTVPPPFSSRNTQFRNRRPLHFARAVKPAPEAYKLEGGKPAGS